MSSAAKLGLFMLVILAVLAYFVLKIEEIDVRRGRGTKEVTAIFDNIAGLDRKSAVRVAGVRAGKVKDIQLRPDGRAEVTLEIDSDVPLRADAVAKIANLGLLGEKYVELDPGTPTAPLRTEEKIVLRGTQPASMDDVTNQVSAIATDVKAITESLRTVMAGPQGEKRLEDVVANVHTITAEMRAMIAGNRGNVDATVANMRALTAQLRVELPRLAASIDRVAGSIAGTVGENRADVRDVVENLKAISADMVTTSENLNAITGQVKSGEGSIGKLLYSPEAHDRLTSALASVESGVTELKSTLGRVNRIGLDVGVKADYMAGLDKSAEGFDNLGGNSRSAVSLRLTPDPDRNRFYHVELSDHPRGRREDKVRTETRTNPATGESSTTIVEETRFDRDFLITAQAGWLLDNLAVRVGLIDSAGGVGVDYRFSERLAVTGEAFDFGGQRDPNPHLRLFSEYTLRKEKPQTPRLFVTTGVDNPFNDLTVTVGGGIRWRDDDLKWLLGTLPIK